MADGHDGQLETGYGAETATGDNLALDVMRDYGRSFAAMAEATGKPASIDDDLGVVMADCQAPTHFLNPVSLTRPISEANAELLARRAKEFYAQRPGGQYSVWSIWPTPDLREHGLSAGGHPPFMLRAAGGDAPRTPDGLDIVRVDSPQTLADYQRALISGFGMLSFDDAANVSVFEGDAAYAPGWHHFVGYVDGVPAATAAAYTGERVTRVDNVSTRREFRGRGYGEALTWHATVVRPDTPAVLFASDMGRPVYERMGYVTVLRATTWVGNR